VTSLRPAAVLWDMDGTLVDTEPYWLVAEQELVARFGGVWSVDDGMKLVGSGLWHSARVFQAHGVKLSEDEIVAALTDRVLEQVEAAVPWRPGARELLQDLADHGIPTALVTMSTHRMARQIVDALGFDGFQAIVGGDDVEHAKPHPQPYQLGAQALGVAPENCVALEDSAPGIASALAAGAVVVGVPLHLAIEEHHSYDLRDVADLDATKLVEIFAARRA
jgi:HAD superfamily hydrolase (TIGR01509 family)